MSLWQKPENTDRQPAPKPSTGTKPSPSPSAERETRMDSRLVNIGQSIKIVGELTGNEDLTIDGKIDGKIILKDHHLTIGSNGRINAEIDAKSVLVNGEVVGNIRADDKIELAPTGSVQGDLCAPRVALADGSSFKGAIDMSGKSVSTATGAVKTHATQQLPRSASGTKA